MLRSLRRRSPVGWALLLIAAGAVSVLVAWMPWRLTEPRWESVTPIARFAVDGRLYGASWELPSGIRRHAAVYPMGVIEPGNRDAVTSDPIPWWMPRHAIRYPERVGMRLIYEAQANGWPFPCVRSVEGAARAGGRAHARAFHVNVRSPVRIDRVLPYGVVWWGMLANIAVYALAILVVLETWLALRRRRRVRRSRCPWCGYDLVGAPDCVCPECGVNAC